MTSLPAVGKIRVVRNLAEGGRTAVGLAIHVALIAIGAALLVGGMEASKKWKGRSPFSGLRPGLVHARAVAGGVDSPPPLSVSNSDQAPKISLVMPAYQPTLSS